MTEAIKPLLATYRLQFHRGFTFDDAAGIVPYLHELGITHVYASPYFAAVAGSTHGYDVIDHGRLNPEIGDAKSYARFVDTLAAYGMSHILDIVPNHVGVDTNDNVWWNEVLRDGRGSKYAEYFDIDWEAGGGKLLLPVLGESIGAVVDGGKVKVEGDQVVYFDRRFPLNPSPGAPVEGRGEDELGLKVASIDPNHPDPSPHPASRERRLEDSYRLVQSQHYRLCHWKVAPDEINYRRFFDVTSLAAIRMERPEVFTATHTFLFELIAAGKIAGVRTDHPDGLTDPKAYLDQLQSAYEIAVPDSAASLPVWVEKILSTGESLPVDWPVTGTSGYDFLAAVNSLLVDPASESAMSAVYQDFTGETDRYDDVVYTRKWNVLENALVSELTRLTARLKTIAEADRSTRDFTARQLRDALQTVIACFPVYRTYVAAGQVTDDDNREVAIAIARAYRRSPKIDHAVFQLIADAVMQRLPGREKLTLPFAQKFQQLTSPVTAKGVEDTSFYVFNRLTSLNEVGGDPGRFGSTADDLHAYFTDRQQHWPAALSCLSTHDTKRSEDVRARISALAEMPDHWKSKLAEFEQTRPRTVVSANDRYLLYQTLLGSWTDGDPARYVQRIQAYMLKAVREAKTRSSWTEPDEAYESSLKTFIAELISDPAGEKFRAAFNPLLKKVSAIGYFNSLAQTLIRLTAPGVPDTYQGTELWDFSLVDPDNRRPVDYAARAAALKAIAGAEFGRLLETIDDGRAKLFLTQRALRARLKNPGLFQAGQYIPLRTTGRFAGHIFAFARENGDRTVVVVAGRLLCEIGDPPTGAAWDDTAINLPKPGQYRSELNGHPIVAGDSIRVAELFGDWPIAFLTAGTLA